MSILTQKALKITEGHGTKECITFREELFKRHPPLSIKLAHHYVRIAKKHGYVKANNAFLELRNRLSLGNKYHCLYIDSSYKKVEAFSERLAAKMKSILFTYGKSNNQKKTIKRICKLVEGYDMPFPIKNLKNANDDELASALARCLDPIWWRRKIIKRQDSLLEHLHIQLGYVSKEKGKYASNFGVTRKQEQWKNNEQGLALLEVENDLGQVFDLLDVIKKSTAGLENRRHELMTRLDGIEKVAQDRKDIGVFYTITTPSKYHSQLSKSGKANPKYNNATPKETNQYLNDIWKKIRAKFHRHGIQPYGFRVVEPHADGTPHWHILLFMPSEHVQTVSDIIRDYSLKEDGDERGAQKHRFTEKRMDPEKGSAAGYMAKYISKGIDGKGLEKDLYGGDAKDSCIRIRAWASIWNIRQFQPIGGPSVVIWREVRRLAHSGLSEKALSSISSERLALIIKAADEGDWKSYVDLSGGPTVARKDQPLRALHIIKKSLNKYGEIVKSIKGFIFEGCTRVITRPREWVIRRKDISLPRLTQSVNHFGGGANAPPLEFCQ